MNINAIRYDLDEIEDCVRSINYNVDNLDCDGSVYQEKIDYLNDISEICENIADVKSVPEMNIYCEKIQEIIPKLNNFENFDENQKKVNEMYIRGIDENCERIDDLTYTLIDDSLENP